jgi:hypothetical protein
VNSLQIQIDKSTHVGLTGVTLRDEHPTIASAVVEALENTPANLLSPERKVPILLTLGARALTFRAVGGALHHY